jgi:cysteinyl-tRNA synthetase
VLSRKAISKLTDFASRIGFEYNGSPQLKKDFGPFYPVQEALLTDLNTPEALGRLFRLVRELTEAWHRGEFDGETDKIKAVHEGYQACLDAFWVGCPKQRHRESIDIPSDIQEIGTKKMAV